MKLQDISSIKWKETKVAHPGVFVWEAMKRDYDLASTFDQEDLSLQSLSNLQLKVILYKLVWRSMSRNNQDNHEHKLQTVFDFTLFSRM